VFLPSPYSIGLCSFTTWCAAQGISKLAVWRADIAALLYKLPHYCGIVGWTYPLLEAFMDYNKTTPPGVQTLPAATPTVQGHPVTRLGDHL
jgi:hypothetical protein